MWRTAQSDMVVDDLDAAYVGEVDDAGTCKVGEHTVVVDTVDTAAMCTAASWAEDLEEA